MPLRYLLQAASVMHSMFVPLRIKVGLKADMDFYYDRSTTNTSFTHTCTIKTPISKYGISKLGSGCVDPIISTASKIVYVFLFAEDGS